MNKLPKNKISVCYVLSYKSPSYIRTRFLLSLLRSNKKIKLHQAINTNKGVLRYFQTLSKLLIVRIRYNPDVYILGFNGHGIFWPVRVLTAGKPLIFDEFINAYDWLTLEHEKIKRQSLIGRVMRLYFKSITHFSSRVLTDTKIHACRSAEVYNEPVEKFQHVYVGTDEEIFNKKELERVSEKKSEYYNVFFYGTFLPLHGVKVIIDALVMLKKLPISLTIIGTDKAGKLGNLINEARTAGAKIKHINWVDFEELPKYIAEADICLGGPFGNTPQAKKVITGKTFQFMSTGKATIVGRINENVGFKDKDNVLLVDQGSADALRSALEWSFRHQKEAIKIGKAGRLLYEKKFSLDAQASIIFETIRGVVLR